jgi:hypothetical protein
MYSSFVLRIIEYEYCCAATLAILLYSVLLFVNQNLIGMRFIMGTGSIKITRGGPWPCLSFDSRPIMTTRDFGGNTTSCADTMLRVLLGVLWSAGLSGFSSPRFRLASPPAPCFPVAFSLAESVGLIRPGTFHSSPATGFINVTRGEPRS